MDRRLLPNDGPECGPMIAFIILPIERKRSFPCQHQAAHQAFMIENRPKPQPRLR
jgi:hypothetical protein